MAIKHIMTEWIKSDHQNKNMKDHHCITTKAETPVIVQRAIVVRKENFWSNIPMLKSAKKIFEFLLYSTLACMNFKVVSVQEGLYKVKYFCAVPFNTYGMVYHSLYMLCQNCEWSIPKSIRFLKIKRHRTIEILSICDLIWHFSKLYPPTLNVLYPSLHERQGESVQYLLSGCIGFLTSFWGKQFFPMLFVSWKRNTNSLHL